MDSMECRLGNVGDGMGVGVKEEEKNQLEYFIFFMKKKPTLNYSCCKSSIFCAIDVTLK